MSETEKIIESLKAPKNKHVIPTDSLLSSGSSMVNLACSGRIQGAFAKGTYIHYVGSSRCGKSLLCHATLAEASINPTFDGYDLIYDNVEKREFWDIEKFWGPKLAARIQPPGGTKDKPIYSATVQDMYYLLHDRKKVNKPFIWIEDSMASLDDAAKQEKFETNRKKAAAGKELEGSYGMGKAKANSDNLLWVCNMLAETGSILIIINQTRDTVGFGAQFNPNTVAGGRALKFYACHELWGTTTGEIKKTVNGKQRQIGTMAQIKVKKNSINGKERTVDIPIYHSFGIDDVGSMVDYLIEEKHWEEKKGVVTAPEFGHEGSIEKLIKSIEADELESELKKLTQKVWDSVEEACVVQRKSKYS